MDVELSSISVQAELERMGWDYSFVGDDEVKCRCPAHDDETASACININKRVWKCHAAGCGAKGDIVTFIGMATKEPSRRVVIEFLSKFYNLSEVKTIDQTVVERYHLGIWRAGPLLKALRDRGVSDESIRLYRLGVHSKRITIPILNRNGHVINVRRYLPGAPSKDKMRNTRGHGKVQLFPVEQLKYETIVVCGGEIKAIVVAQHLNHYKIGAVTATAGEDAWSPAFSQELADKRVIVCLDIDKVGKKGADKLCAQIRGQARWTGRLDLPLDLDKYPHGDVNDYFGQENQTVDDFMQLLDQVSLWQPKTIEQDIGDVETVELILAESTHAKYTGKRIAVKGIVTAMDTTPYIIPKTVRCNCTRDQEFCSECPIFGHTPDDDGCVEMTLHCESPAILEMVNAGKKQQHDALRQGLRIPPCKVVTFKPLAHYNVEDIRVSPQLEIGAQRSEQVLIPALSISHGLEMNAAYSFEGRSYPHPRTQQAILLISKSEPADDSLSTHRPTEDELNELAIFQPTEWSVEGIHQQLDDLYDDIEANVTRIFKRRELHLAIDLAYHSVLLFYFDKQITKGWVEVLVVGDSSQGKTETTKQLMEHYSLGEKVECKNASVPGLLGGLQQLGNRWFVTWGIIPTHDRRLVILEELKGASVEVIAKLTDMRSSGVAEIPKIEKRRTHARTRLIALSNPRSDRPVSSYNYGVDVIRELIGSPEDIRRFDFHLVLSSQQVSPSELNVLASSRPKIEHKYTADLCRRCVLWAWTRTPEQVEFTEDATTAVLDAANMMCSKYADVIPIVDRGSMRHKLARLATAMAARTFSTGPKSNKTIVVRTCHVQYIVEFMDTTYSDPVFGYAAYSEAYLSTRKLLDLDGIKRKVLATPFARDFIEQTLYVQDIELRDICDWTGWERGATIELLSYLVRKHALQRYGSVYRKSPEFIKLLKVLQNSKELDIVDRPSHVEEAQEEF